MAIEADKTMGSVGSLVGAAMETAGHYLQSQMLDLFNDGFGATYGALFYVIAAVVALFTVGIGGNYKFGLWFFIGPGLFFWSIGHRVPSAGANWKFGEQIYPQGGSIQGLRWSVRARPRGSIGLRAS